MRRRDANVNSFFGHMKTKIWVNNKEKNCIGGWSSDPCGNIKEFNSLPATFPDDSGLFVVVEFQEEG